MDYVKELVFYIVLITIFCGFFMLFFHWILYPFFLKLFLKKKEKTWRAKLKTLGQSLSAPETVTTFTFIGSSQYEQKMKEAADKYREAGHVVYMPAFDHEYDDALVLWGVNRERIRAADVVVVFWDQRSTGTIFDIGMTFAFEKPIIIGFLEGRTLGTTLVQYAGMKEGKDENNDTTAT